MSPGEIKVMTRRAQEHRGCCSIACWARRRLCCVLRAACCMSRAEPYRVDAVRCMLTESRMPWALQSERVEADCHRAWHVICRMLLALLRAAHVS